MQAGNVTYKRFEDLPSQVALFPLSGVLLLPAGQLPLNIFEDRYLQMVEDAIKTNHLIGMIQPISALSQNTQPALYQTGCLGRITAFSESGDGRVLIHLQGICRFTLGAEKMTGKPYRIAEIKPFLEDLEEHDNSDHVDREELLQTFEEFLQVNEMEADWDSIMQASTQTLVNALSSIAPFGVAEKQALLEAPDTATRAQTLIALTERTLMMKQGHEGSLN